MLHANKPVTSYAMCIVCHAEQPFDAMSLLIQSSVKDRGRENPTGSVTTFQSLVFSYVLGELVSPNFAVTASAHWPNKSEEIDHTIGRPVSASEVAFVVW